MSLYNFNKVETWRRRRIRTLYRVQQKYLTNLQNSCEWNRWRGEFVIERPSSETQSISVVMERWPVKHRAFAVETYFKNNDSVLTQRIFRRHFNIHRNECLPLRISLKQGVRKETKDNGGFETEHQGRSGSNFSQHAATSDAHLPETLGIMCWQQGTPPHRHYIQEVNVVIKMLWVKDNFSNKFA